MRNMKFLSLFVVFSLLLSTKALNYSCKEPFVWQNYSRCYYKTCENKDVPNNCYDIWEPACVCPEDKYLLNSNCVDLPECYNCVVDGETKAHGEIWNRTDTCNICHCWKGQVDCHPIIEEPECEEGRVITYDDGPCSPKCKPIPPACRLEHKTRILIMKVGERECVTQGEVTYGYWVGMCGQGTDIPVLTMQGNSGTETVGVCACCKGTVVDHEPVTLKCVGVNDIVDTLQAQLPILSNCTCDNCVP